MNIVERKERDLFLLLVLDGLATGGHPCLGLPVGPGVDVGIRLVVDESGTKDHGAEESVEHHGLPVLLDALSTRGQRLLRG